MAVRLQQKSGGIYFITFTCYRWKPLFQLSNTYSSVYKWFDHLYEKGGSVIGYVIMPNHLHVLLHLPLQLKSVNTITGNAKRFMAYAIIKSLEQDGQETLLQELQDGVKQRERKKGQRHRVFEESFDAKECFSLAFIEQKLTYMHYNPVSGKWMLADDFTLYPHSSAGIYFGSGASAYKKVVRVKEIREEAFREVPGSR